MKELNEIVNDLESTLPLQKFILNQLVTKKDNHEIEINHELMEDKAEEAMDKALHAFSIITALFEDETNWEKQPKPYGEYKWSKKSKRRRHKAQRVYAGIKFVATTQMFIHHKFSLYPNRIGTFDRTIVDEYNILRLVNQAISQTKQLISNLKQVKSLSELEVYS